MRIITEPTTHLGTAQLYKRHSVMIEGGVVPRARVMDQRIIDRYLMNGWLDLAQHRAAELILDQASRAGIWAKGVNWAGSGGGGTQNYVPFGAFPLGRTMDSIRKRFGEFHAYVTQEVVIYDWDISKHKRRMKCLRQSLDLIDALKVRHGPLRELKRVIKKEGAEAPQEGAP